MSPYCIYLTLPTYLAEWYAHQCRRVEYREHDTCPNTPPDLSNPVEPIRGSYESQVLHRSLQKQPTDIPEPRPDNATLALAIPYYPDRDPRIYNYVGPHARQEIENAILESFDISMWKELHTFRTRLTRQDEAIWSFMEKHAISCTDANWNAIAKRYQRKRNIFYVEKCRKNRTSSRTKNKNR